MPLHPDDEVELTVEKPAAGGRMIARHEGQVVLLLGGIPGEIVRARIRRVERQVAFADAVDILRPSTDRREAAADPLCGGCLYSHIDYDRQVALKGEVVRDAFLRLGRVPLEAPVPVEGSPDRGYRLRARLHVREDRVGFYREGTHDLCDAAATGQLSDAAVGAASITASRLARDGVPATALELSENLDGSERAVHITPAAGGAPTQATLEAILRDAQVIGCTCTGADGLRHTAGVPVVGDPLPDLTLGRVPSGRLERHAESFFQANRFLLPRLVTGVMDAAAGEGDVVDLYAGVGLFSISLAASGRRGITAVEGDRTSGRDLQRNAAQCAGALRVALASVEDYLRRQRGPAPGTVIVDPPRTGISRAAMEGVIGVGAPRVVYVSCDPATMARDARRLLDAGYRLTSLRAFDLFPNTPHVESLGIFAR